jgi:hypothetical protein
MSRKHVAILALVALPIVALNASAFADDARVTVVTILATPNNTTIDPKLNQLAAEVKKHEQNLTGFKLVGSQLRDVTVGQKESFRLLDDGTSADVTILGREDAKKRFRMSVKPPMVGEINYSISYEKYFPIVTRLLSNNERLIIAVMVQPAKEKAKDAK